MFNTQKIDPSLWPWAYLGTIGQPDPKTRSQMRDTVQGNMPYGTIGSSTDIRYNFKDTYVDLSYDVEYLSQLSIDADQPYL